MLTIRAIPMLNPDGAEVFRRRNAQNIDINRDTINLETPEANILLEGEWFKPEDKQGLSVEEGVMERFSLVVRGSCSISLLMGKS